MRIAISESLISSLDIAEILLCSSLALERGLDWVFWIGLLVSRDMVACYMVRNKALTFI